MAGSSWLKALSECLVLIVRQAMHAEIVAVHGNNDVKNLLASQFFRLWTELVMGWLQGEVTEAVGLMARTVDRVGKIGDGALMLIMILWLFSPRHP